MPARYSYAGYLETLKKDAEIVDQTIETIRTTVKLHGPRAVQEEIAALSRQPVDRGTYRRSFRFENIAGGATAYNFAPYASVIEFGRRAGAKAPPLSVIEAWLRRKKIVRTSRASRSGKAITEGGIRKHLTKRRREENAIRSLAFVIARSISRKGLPAHLILTAASETIDREVKRAIDRLLARRT